MGKNKTLRAQFPGLRLALDGKKHKSD